MEHSSVAYFYTCHFSCDSENFDVWPRLGEIELYAAYIVRAGSLAETKIYIFITMSAKCKW